ncbi:MAG: hypothetical protein HKO76_01500, partial [Acidimicrobiia bacterium]|nr:hypothetical protein [Acidimicrobiia bacterium]
MTVDLERQVSEFWMETSADLPKLDAEEIVLRALEGTDGATLLPVVSGVHRRRGLLAAAVVTTVVVAIGLISLLLHPGDELAPVGTPDSVPREPAVTVPDSTSPEPAPRGDTVVPSSVPDPAVPSTVTDSLGNEWSRVPLDEAVFAGAEVWDVTAGGPGLVAVGFDPMGAAVWTSVDGLRWSRVPHDDAVFGEQSEETYMSDVTAGGPGLVAVG